MKFEDFKKIFPDANEDQFKIVCDGFKTENPTPPDNQTPLAKPQKEIKSNSQITMTAAEFMKLVTPLFKEEKQNNDKKEIENASIFI